MAIFVVGSKVHSGLKISCIRITLACFCRLPPQKLLTLLSHHCRSLTRQVIAAHHCTIQMSYKSAIVQRPSLPNSFPMDVECRPSKAELHACCNQYCDAPIATYFTSPSAASHESHTSFGVSTLLVAFLCGLAGFHTSVKATVDYDSYFHIDIARDEVGISLICTLGQ